MERLRKLPVGDGARVLVGERENAEHGVFEAICIVQYVLGHALRVNVIGPPQRVKGAPFTLSSERVNAC